MRVATIHPVITIKLSFVYRSCFNS